MTNDEILDLLYKNADPKRAIFQKRCTMTGYEVIGNTSPFLISLAKDICKSKDYNDFLDSDSNIYEYVLLQGFVIQ